MTYSIETITGTYSVELQTFDVWNFGTEYHGEIRRGSKVVGRITDFRSTGHGFVVSSNSLKGLSELEAVTLHLEAIRRHKRQAKA